MRSRMDPNPYSPPANAESRHGSRMSFRFACALVAAGVLLFVGSPIYCIVAVGIPPQDATREWAAYAEFHNTVSVIIGLSGVVLTVFGLVGAINVAVSRPFPARTRSRAEA